MLTIPAKVISVQEGVLLMAVLFGVGVLYLGKRVKYVKWVLYLTSLAALILVFGVATRRDISKKVRENLSQTNSPMTLSFWQNISQSKVKLPKKEEISQDIVEQSLAENLLESGFGLDQVAEYDGVARQVLAEYLTTGKWEQSNNLEKYQDNLSEDLQLAVIGVTATWMDNPTMGRKLAESILKNKAKFRNAVGYGLAMTESNPGEVSVVVVMALPWPKKPTVAPTATPIPVHISEKELMTALNQYRKANGKPPVAYDTSLCAYARERVAEHVARYQNLTEGESPLDEHEGFKRDANSGHAFELTRTKYLIENLAFTPNLTTAVKVIEWGWDSSAPHKKGMLSTDVQLACVAGHHPFYVMILGKR